MSGYIIGKVFKRANKYIYITGGNLYGDYSRLSNFWTWRVIKKDGTLGKERRGYGDLSAEPVEAKIVTVVTIKI